MLIIFFRKNVSNTKSKVTFRKVATPICSPLQFCGTWRSFGPLTGPICLTPIVHYVSFKISVFAMCSSLTNTRANMWALYYLTVKLVLSRPHVFCHAFLNLSTIGFSYENKYPLGSSRQYTANGDVWLAAFLALVRLTCLSLPSPGRAVSFLSPIPCFIPVWLDLEIGVEREYGSHFPWLPPWDDLRWWSAGPGDICLCHITSPG